MALSRRDLVKLGIAGGLAVALPLHRTAFTAGIADRLPTSALPARFSLPLRRLPELGAAGMSTVRGFDGVERPYRRYDVNQQFVVATILPGFKTPVFGYNGKVPGPTIRAYRNTPLAVNQTNLLHRPPPAPYQSVPVPSPYTDDPVMRSTSTHLHGSASLPQFDGYASDVTLGGQYKTYFYPNCQEARTLWYHDHGVHHTSNNVYNGLAGMYILHDEVEAKLGIPTGASRTAAALRYDVPLLIRDAMFAKDGSLIFDNNSESGVHGDVILINGVPWPFMNVEPRKYRFRLLNGSVSRSYRWQLHDGRAPVPMTVIGTDGGLVPKPQVVTTLLQGMAERYEVVIDFAEYKGARLTLRNLMPDNNVDYETVATAMQFRVGAVVSNRARNAVPSYWEDAVPVPEVMGVTETDLATQGVKQRSLRFERQHGQWTINGETWQNVIDSGYSHSIADPELDSFEIWDLENKSGGWFHPVHIHLVDFQVLSRNGSSAEVHPEERGPKDVVYVGENETVRLGMKFGGPSAGEGWPTPRGRYMIHCHNLVHEDHDMMTQFNVGDPEQEPAFDPIKAAPPVNL